jgi:hypothetical protein
MSKRIERFTSEEGDWEALYVDGRLEVEGHSLDAHQIFKALDVEYTSREVSSEWLDAHGCTFPMNSEDFDGDGL